MGVTSYHARIAQALTLKANPSIWCALGHTAEWPSEPTPTAEDPSISVIDTPIVYVVPNTISLAKVVSSNGDFVIAGQAYAFVSDANAYTETARFLYMKFHFDPALGQPYANFRQHGIYVGLVPGSGHENDQWLAPVNVSNPGRLYFVENHTVKSLDLGESRDIEILIEFR